MVNARAAAKFPHSIYGVDAACERTWRKWLSHFRNGDFSLKGELSEGHLCSLNSKVPEAAAAAKIVIMVGEHFSVNPMITYNQLKKLRKIIGRLVVVLGGINSCGLLDAKSCLYIYIYIYIWFIIW